jgi:hypothetical protein
MLRVACSTLLLVVGLPATLTSNSLSDAREYLGDILSRGLALDTVLWAEPTAEEEDRLVKMMTDREDPSIVVDELQKYSYVTMLRVHGTVDDLYIKRDYRALSAQLRELETRVGELEDELESAANSFSQFGANSASLRAFIEKYRDESRSSSALSMKITPSLFKEVGRDMLALAEPLGQLTDPLEIKAVFNRLTAYIKGLRRTHKDRGFTIHTVHALLGNMYGFLEERANPKTIHSPPRLVASLKRLKASLDVKNAERDTLIAKLADHPFHSLPDGSDDTVGDELSSVAPFSPPKDDVVKQGKHRLSEVMRSYGARALKEKSPKTRMDTKLFRKLETELFEILSPISELHSESEVDDIFDKLREFINTNEKDHLADGFNTATISVLLRNVNKLLKAFVFK